MKKVLLCTFATAAVFAACNKQEIAPKYGDGLTAINLGIPEAMGLSTRAGVEYTNSAKGGVTNVGADELRWDVKIIHKGSNLVAYEETQEGSIEYKDVIRLAAGEEFILKATAKFENPENVELFNTEREDHYTVTKEFTAGAATLDAELKRPVGKLRLVATDYDLFVEQTSKKIAKVDIVYSGASTSSLTADFNTYVTETLGTTMFVDYLAGGADGATNIYKFNVVLTMEDGSTKTVDVTQDIPVKANALTTVVGNLFTGITDLRIIVDEGFENGEEKFTPAGASIVSSAIELTDVATTNAKVYFEAKAQDTEINLGPGFTDNGTTASELYIKYTELPSSITLNQKGYDYNTPAAPAESLGKVIIELPEGDVTSIIITAPNLTVEIVGAGTYSSLDALTAYNTLVVKKGVTIENLNVRGGNVYVEAGAAVEAITKADDVKRVYICSEEGAAIPKLAKDMTQNAFINVTSPEHFSLVNAVSMPESSYTLQEDVVLNFPVFVTGKFTLDLNGKAVTAVKMHANDNGGVSDRLFEVREGGEFIINDTPGNGKIETLGDYSKGEPDLALSIIPGNCRLIINGGLIHAKNYAAIAGNGLKHETTLVINGAEIISDNDHAIYHPQNGDFVMQDGRIKGVTGIEFRGGGSATILNGEIVATADTFTKADNNSGSTIEGAAIAVNLYDLADREEFNLTILNGKFEGQKAVYSIQPKFVNFKEKVTVRLIDGEFIGGITGRHNMNEQEAFDVIGGTFNNFDSWNKMTDGAGGSRFPVTYRLTKDMRSGNLNLKAGQKVIIDLNGHKLTLGGSRNQSGTGADKVYICYHNLEDSGNLTITDSKLSSCPAEPNLIIGHKYSNDDVTSQFFITEGGKLTLSKIKTNASTSKTKYLIWANQGDVLIEDSDISAHSYILTTNASEVNNGSYVSLEYGCGGDWRINNSTLTAATPIMLNVPKQVSVNNSIINGTAQCAMVRGGTMFVCESVFNYTRETAFTELDTWLDGNNVPMAAITGGNKGTGAYQYQTQIMLDENTVINMLGAYQENPKVYLYGDGYNTVSYGGPYGVTDGSVKVGSTDKVEVYTAENE